MQKSHSLVCSLSQGAAFVALVVSVAGCQPQPTPIAAAKVTDSEVRAARRAYYGAPPVIPHPPLGAKCVSCHTNLGKEAMPIGIAPANPHGLASGIGGENANCQQCHLFAKTKELFAESTFVGLSASMPPGERLHPLAPPTIPHRILMRENCLGCHASPAARPEIRCSHPDRINCVQCHVGGEKKAESFATKRLTK